MANNKGKVVFDENGTGHTLTPINSDDDLKGRKPTPDRGFAQMWLRELRHRRNEVSVGAFWVFSALVEQMDRIDGVVFYELDDIRQAVGLKHTSSTSKMISELVIAGWVRRVRRSVVAINPHLAWRGKTDDRGVSKFRWDNNLPQRRKMS